MQRPAAKSSPTISRSVGPGGRDASSKKVAFINPRKNRFPYASPHRQQAVPMTQPLDISGEIIGGRQLSWIAGPTQVESSAQMVAVGTALKELGVKFLRAGVERTDAKGSDFRGLGAIGLKLLKATATRFDLLAVSELNDVNDLEMFSHYVDVIEVCPKSAQSTVLVEEVGKLEKTVILHRSPVMTFDEYITMLNLLEKGGKAKIILCDNGVCSFDGRLNRMLDLSSLVTLKRETSHPVFIDCCAVASDWSYAEKLAIAAIAAGADGIMAELQPSVQSAQKRALVQDEMSAMMFRSKALKSTLNALTFADFTKVAANSTTKTRP